MTDETQKAMPAGLRARGERLAPAEAIRREWHLTVPGGLSIHENMENLARPDFLSALASRLHPMDRIEVVDDDLTFFAEFMVLQTNPDRGVVLKLLRGMELDSVGAPDTIERNTGGLVARHKGPHLKWCVFRGASMLKDRLPTEQAAYQWIRAHVQAQAKGAA